MKARGREKMEKKREKTEGKQERIAAQVNKPCAERRWTKKKKILR